jgi:hypothetical protein
VVPRCFSVAMALAVLAPAVATVADAFEVGAAGDLCNGTCELKLCLSGIDRPRLGPCSEGANAAPAVVVRMNGFRVESPARSGPIRPDLRLRLRGVRATLTCDNTSLAACQSRCGTDADCAGNGLLSRCDNGHCGATTACPGPGYYLGTLSFENAEVVTPSEPCSGICEFRLCLIGERLIPCAEGAAPDVVVRAPSTRAERRFGSLVLKHGRRHLVLTCYQSAGPCVRGCTTDAHCFSGSRCEEGYCKATALCKEAVTTTTTTTTMDPLVCPTTTSLGAPPCHANGAGVCLNGQDCVLTDSGFYACQGPERCGAAYFYCGGQCPFGQACDQRPVPAGCGAIGCACQQMATKEGQ